jgi:hypothetical protein
MSEIKKKSIYNYMEGRTENWFEDKAGRRYRRIIGGLAWPHGDKPGFALVLAEDEGQNPAADTAPIRVLAEYQNLLVPELIDRCGIFSSIYEVQAWLGDTTHLPMMKLTNDRIQLSKALFADDSKALQFYINLITELTQIGQKILHFGEDSQLRTVLRNLSPDRLGANVAEYPPIAALGYALAALRFNQAPSPHLLEEARALRQRHVRSITVSGI